jgi:hypothetical protein
MKLPKEFLEAAHQEESRKSMETGVALGHFERKIDRRGMKSYRITPRGEVWFVKLGVVDKYLAELR